MVKPILFNTEMVRSILDGRKTVTRRVVKYIPLDAKISGVYYDCVTFCWRQKAKNVDVVFDKEKDVNLPYRPDDILWVRETWARHDSPIEGVWYGYKADGRDETPDGRWKPSIHMPREAARIFLRATDVRVERLDQIVDDPPGPHNQIVREGFRYGCDFIAAWENRIKPADRELYGWFANPWVWVIEFERCEKTEVRTNG